MATTQGSFTITSWEEEEAEVMPGGGRLVRAHVLKRYEGGLQGEGAVEYLMVYAENETAQFVGYEVVIGSLDGAAGSFLFEHGGTFEDGHVESTWEVVAGSGSDALEGLRGIVYFSAGHQATYDFELDYSLREAGLQ